MLSSFHSSGQNIGIGTTSPPAKLTVVGNGSSPAIPGGTSNGVFRVGVTPAEAIDFGKMTANPYAAWMQAGFNGNSDPLSLQPLGGNVGIGTINPDAALHIQRYSTNNLPLLVVDNTFDQTTKMAFRTDYRTWMVGQNKPPDAVGLTDAFFIYDSNANASRFIISTSGNIGIGIHSPSARLHLNETGSGKGVVFAGEWQASPANPPVSGAGTRAMWYPDKAAFRAGKIDGTQWDITNTGNYSMALGINCKASGSASFATGSGTNATGSYSTAMGYFCNATDDDAFAVGHMTNATENASTAMGNSSTASGFCSAAIGFWVTAPGYCETVLGKFNESYTPASPTGDPEDRLFSLGNGNSVYPSNALTILNNGCIGVKSVTSPTYALELPNNSANQTGRGRAYAWDTYSDKRVKTDIRELGYGLDEVMMLEPMQYYHHNSLIKNKQLVIEPDGAIDIGFLAQDVYRIIPEVVSMPQNDAADLWSMSYEKLVPVLTKAIQEQQAMIEELQGKVEELENQLKVDN